MPMTVNAKIYLLIPMASSKFLLPFFYSKFLIIILHDHLYDADHDYAHMRRVCREDILACLCMISTMSMV
jgi:sterol desaturase/sphingolipid hydroxylase (fatty acid hydroxylase superfamily)